MPTELGQALIEGYHALTRLDALLLTLNLLLLLFSGPILGLFDNDQGERHRRRLHLLRAANMLMLLAIIFGNFLLPTLEYPISRLLGLFAVAYIAFLSHHLLAHLLRKRFGREREIEGRKVLSDTYSSRALSLIGGISIFVVACIMSLEILGLDSRLQGGVLGFIGVFLALTQGSWAPDIISGLVILNSRLVEEGDVIEFNDGGALVYGLVFKTKIFHTEILDLVNNHRVMVQNARLRGLTLNNLSRFASARGLRERLDFRIGYDVNEKRVAQLLQDAFALASSNRDIAIEANHAPQILATDAGDDAITWSLFYHTKEPRLLHRTRQRLRALVIGLARERGISLATPRLVQISGPLLSAETSEITPQASTTPDTQASQPGTARD